MKPHQFGADKVVGSLCSLAKGRDLIMSRQIEHRVTLRETVNSTLLFVKTALKFFYFNLFLCFKKLLDICSFSQETN